ncbi:MAG: 16S rRNA (guanine(966)-N(2))-methyltransferase RsmD [Acidiferrobacteraceae bacterium]
MAENRQRRRPPGTVRIIGGRWRSRRLAFPEAGGLRPSPDRIRVTLFNWLVPVLTGARCLDLFAGSGCLGLEALSRGALEAVLVENNPAVAAALRANIGELKAHGALVVEGDARRFLAAPAAPFDIVFVDPPFAQGLVRPVLPALTTGWLKPEAFVYVESAADDEPFVPPGLEVVRDKTAGAVRYRLLRNRP